MPHLRPALEYVNARAIMDNMLNDAGDLPVAVCVVNDRCEQLCAGAIHGVGEPSVLAAYAKAVTSVRFQRDTAAFRFVERGVHPQLGTKLWRLAGHSGWSDFDLKAASGLNTHFCAWAGGSPVLDDNGWIIGAVGVSGLDELEDQDLAERRPVWSER